MMLGTLLSLGLKTGVLVFMKGLELGSPDGPRLTMLGASGVTFGLKLSSV